MEEPNRQILEVISVARDEATAGLCGARQMLFIGKAGSVQVMDANRVEAVFSEDFRDDGTEIRVQIVLHWAS